MSLKEFTKELNGRNGKVEGELIKTVFYSLLTGLGLLAILYYFKFRFIESFLSEEGFFLFFAVLSYSLIIPTIRQVRAYREFACMSGMMIGMTTGMIVGFMGGFYLGATNGMFVGSVFGMAVGILIGTWMGKCCGIMGFLEGMMAGFMGGLMGAMTAVMMLNDNLKAATVVIFIISSAILFSLNYMIYKETKDNETERQLREDHFWTVALSFVLTVATAWLMIFGPRSLLFGG